MIAVGKGAKYLWVVGVILVGLGSLSATLAAQAPSVAGDFRVGDRIELLVESPLPLHDTLVVREGLTATIPTVGDISLKGVRRADVQGYMTKQLGNYMKDPVIKTTVLVRISVLGPIGRPGFYELPTDKLLSDVIMTAGGPQQNTDLDKTVIVRNGKEIVGDKVVSNALSSGKTLNDLGIASGDQIVVGSRPTRSLLSYMQIISASLGLTLAVITLTRHH